MNDEPVSDGVMIALIPNDISWCQISKPHMTLVYAGTTDDLKPTDFNELGKLASDLALLGRPVTLKVSGIEEFGDRSDPANPPVEVLTLQATPELRAMRRTVEDWNESNWPFNPHVTVGPAGTAIDPISVPAVLTFDKVMLGWGDQELIFSMKGN